jgi:dolichol-phosphate mannosyltransferase
VNRVVSVVVPAYNEAASIGSLLDTILKVNVTDLGYALELIVVDDGSKDGTAEAVKRYTGRGVKYFLQSPNQGKGKAVQRGIAEATGEYILVQDADLEYDPADYIPILAALSASKNGERTSIYGSRTLGQLRKTGWTLTPGRNPGQSFGPWLAGALLSCWTFLLYGVWLSDTLTGYKLYPRAFFRNLKIETRGFETDHEITAKLIRAGYQVREVPVSYRPRSRQEGKKIRASDGLIAVWTLLRFRFTGGSSSGQAGPA